MIISQIFLPRKCSKTLFKQQQASKQSKTRFFAFSKSDSPRSRLKYVAFPCRRTSRFFDIKTTHRRSRLKYVAFPCRRTSRFFDKKQQTDGRVSSISPFRVSGHPVFSTKNNTPTVASALASRVSRLFVSVDISNTLHLFIKNKSFFHLKNRLRAQSARWFFKRCYFFFLPSPPLLASAPQIRTVLP